MDTRLNAELGFWRNDIEKYAHDRENYALIRSENVDRLVDHWPEVPMLKGKGLDLGCGPTSIFEYWMLEMVAIDPLLEEYQKLYIPPYSTIQYIKGYTDNGLLGFPDNYFDYVFCINVLDHTEHYKSLISETRRVLKDGGIFYIMVNFDPVLMATWHVLKWDRQVVEQEIQGFRMLKEVVVWDDENGRYEYWGKHQWMSR